MMKTKIFIIILFTLAIFVSCDTNSPESDPIKSPIIGVWKKKDKPFNIISVNIFEFKDNGAIISDYWGIDSNGEIMPMGGTGKYVTEEFELISEDSIVFTIQKDVDSYRRYLTRFKIEEDSLFLWNSKTLHFHVEDGRYISKSSDSGYVEELYGFARKINAFEYH